MTQTRRSALGRGLDALLPAPSESAPRPADAERSLPIESIYPDPGQPRRVFEADRLAELADSIRVHGIIQPIIVGTRDERGHPIVAGERRWRAAQLAGLHRVPVVVRDTPEASRLEVAIVENVQRVDLDPVEEALAFQRLIELRGYTHEQLKAKVGKDRSTVANALRLLNLPSKVLDMLQTEALSMGHARALLGLQRTHDILSVAQQIVRGGWSVRVTESKIRSLNTASTEGHNDREPDAERDVIVRELEDRLRSRLGVRATLTRKSQAGPGAVVLPWRDLDELDRLLSVLLDESEGGQAS